MDHHRLGHPCRLLFCSNRYHRSEIRPPPRRRLVSTPHVCHPRPPHPSALPPCLAPASHMVRHPPAILPRGSPRRFGHNRISNLLSHPGHRHLWPRHRHQRRLRRPWPLGRPTRGSCRRWRRLSRQTPPRRPPHRSRPSSCRRRPRRRLFVKFRPLTPRFIPDPSGASLIRQP